MAPARKSVRTTMVIEGSLTPAVGVLRRFRQALVTRTDHIDDLEKRGFIVFRPDLVEPEPDVVEPDVDDPEIEVIPPDPEVEVSVEDESNGEVAGGDDST